MNVHIRPQRITDAEAFFRILSDPGFSYFPAKPRSIEEEKDFLRQNSRKRKEQSEYNFTILYEDAVAGGIGFRRNPGFPYVAEAGYFVQKNLWGKGIATAALLQLERHAFNKCGIVRLELTMAVPNEGSRRVAEKAGYCGEGTLRKRLRIGEQYYDCYMYAKIKPQ
ncbi:MAG: GNAT family N-acetyltransferase [Chitinivibrionales bacterium]